MQGQVLRLGCGGREQVLFCRPWSRACPRPRDLCFKSHPVSKQHLHSQTPVKVVILEGHLRESFFQPKLIFNNRYLK